MLHQKSVLLSSFSIPVYEENEDHLGKPRKSDALQYLGRLILHIRPIDIVAKSSGHEAGLRIESCIAGKWSKVLISTLESWL